MSDLSIQQRLEQLCEKYSQLVWYARANPNDMRPTVKVRLARAKAMKQVETDYPDEAAELAGDDGAWSHGFNSGMLACARLLEAYALPLDFSQMRASACRSHQRCRGRVPNAGYLAFVKLNVCIVRLTLSRVVLHLIEDRSACQRSFGLGALETKPPEPHACQQIVAQHIVVHADHQSQLGTNSQLATGRGAGSHLDPQ